MTPNTAKNTVARCTLDAAHRRDHRHGQGEACVPHCVEVVHFGKDSAAVVCHDCRDDTGFIDVHEAEERCRQHIAHTRGSAA